MSQTFVRVARFLFVVIVVTGGVTVQFNSEAGAQQKTPSTSSISGTYALGPTDRVRVKVYGEPDVAGEYEIDSGGYVSIPLAGRVKAAGLTTRQLEQSITSALSKGIVRDPRVNVEIALYRPFYILGEVKKSGEYPYRVGMTVLDAIASAGGFTYRANENKVYLRRAGGAGEEVYPLDAPVLIYPGDNIRVPERFF
ncbi:MAG: polysaccharide export protein [Afipia sp.]|nr:polysaccharide export protein [Afipia sp.]